MMRRRPEDPEILLEAATGAFREFDTYGRVSPSPAWADLTPAQREELFQRQLTSRVLEKALDPRRLSSTARSVLDHIDELPPLTAGD
jgi:hypothetical protein